MVMAPSVMVFSWRVEVLFPQDSARILSLHFNCNFQLLKTTLFCPRASIFLNTQSVAMLWHEEHRDSRAIHNPPKWPRLAMTWTCRCSRKEPMWETSRDSFQSTPYVWLWTPGATVTRAFSSVQPWAVLEKSDWFPAALSTLVPWRSCSRGDTQLKACLSFTLNHSGILSREGRMKSVPR